jgi:hypothetical protein
MENEMLELRRHFKERLEHLDPRTESSLFVIQNYRHFIIATTNNEIPFLPSIWSFFPSMPLYMVKSISHTTCHILKS